MSLRFVVLAATALGLWAQQVQMTTYYVAFLKRPANPPQFSEEESQKIQEGHMANIRKMAAIGKLVLAGPFSDNTTLRGMFVFKTDSLEEAKALAANDPAVKAGRLELEWHPWFSAKGIMVEQESKGEKK